MPSLVEDLYHGFHDHPSWCRDCLTIRDKQGRVVPLEAWPAHLKLNNLIRRRRELGKPVRIIWLKPRRVAASVAVSAEFFHRVPFKAGQHAMIVAHEKDAAAEIFDYYQQFQASYKPYGGVVGLPPLAKGTTGQRLKWANDSYVRIATANNVKTGRAFSLRFLQLDEFAFYRDGRTLMRSLMSSVPSDPDTMVIVPSTANGVGGPFYDLWREATDPAGTSEWVGLFFGWHEHPEYSRAIAGGAAAAFQRSLGISERYGDEPAERAKYNLTLAQLNWRRWCIDNTCGGSLDTFRQEYPGNPEEAFLASGRPMFSQEALGRMNIVREPLRGRLTLEQYGVESLVRFIEHEKGEVAIYRRPERGRLYAIGADAASGKDINDGKGSEDRDWCVASVLDAATGEQVAKVRVRLEPAPWGAMLYTLGRYYNWSYLVPESNTWGIGALEELLRRAYPIGQIYERGRQADDRRTESVHKIGFETNTVTRPQLISSLDAAIREYAVLIRDANTLQECLTFVLDARGRPAGQQGCHDDEVFALALGVVGLRAMPREKVRAPGPQSAVMRYKSRRGRPGKRDED